MVQGLPAHEAWTFDGADRLMRRCDSAIIIGYARWRWQDADGHMVRMPTEYSHYDGALAVAHKVPLPVITESGILDRGIVGSGHGKLVTWIPDGADESWVQENPFRSRLDAWSAEIRRRPRVFLGYCSQARSTADALTLFLERQLMVPVRNYAMDFNIGGATILEEIEKASTECTCGIFLFTKDDPLVAETEDQAAPRDNVVFEAGYFASARGKDRILIIREDGAKMPADLGGCIYALLRDRADISTLHNHLERFLAQRL
jgi:hypothetical protein